MGSERLAPTRRTLLIGVAVAAAAGCAAPAAARSLLASGPAQGAREVVSFHMDQPFLDPTGRGKPYVPAAGAATRLPEAVFLHHPYL